MAYYHSPNVDGPLPDTFNSSPANVSSVAEDRQPDGHQGDLYTAYHPSLGPEQPNDIFPASYRHPEEPARPYDTQPSQEKEHSTTPPNTAPEVAQVGFYQPQPGYGHRSLSPTLSQGSTNVGSHGGPWVGSSVVEGEDKEVARAYHGEVPVPQPRQRKRICGLSAKLFWILVALLILILLGAGLGAGFGISLSKKKADGTATATSTLTNGSTPFTGDPSYSVGGVIDPAYYTTSGAFNGSGIAFAGSALNEQLKGEYTVYYQHHSGQIRYLQKVGGEYKGGTPSETVASNAKNATPISVVQYVAGGYEGDVYTGYAAVVNWHVFYVGKDGYIKQRTWTSMSNIWEDGPATSQNMKAFDADSIGLQACWYGSLYDSRDLSSFPGASDSSQNTTFLAKYGMNLWYASDDSTFQQYAIYQNQPKWERQDEWRGLSGHAGVGCYSWLPGTTTYAMFVNQQNTVELWWRDTNETLPSTTEHPINSWVLAKDVKIPNAYPSTSLGFTTYFYAMLDDSTIHGYNISFNAENSTFFDADSNTVTMDTDIVVSDLGGPMAFLNATHMTVSEVPDSVSKEESLLVFSQTRGDDITLFRRNKKGGQRTGGPLPVDRE